MATTIYNLFTEFGTSEVTVNIDFTSTNVVKTAAHTVIRGISTALGSESFKKIIALCGDTYFDTLVNHADVKTAYERWNDGEFLRATQLGPEYNSQYRGFDYAGITWLNYRGAIGGTNFINAQQARFVPVGVRDLFLEVMGPADFMETVNTRGKRLYAKQEAMPYNKGIELHTQSNVLFLCTRPRCLYKGTGTFS
jgi:hypothetical protein